MRSKITTLAIALCIPFGIGAMLYCSHPENQEKQNHTPETQSQILQTNDTDSIKRIAKTPTPEGFHRIACDSNSFCHYLRHLPLKEENIVFLHTGKKKPNQSANYAVIDMEIGTKDLQQCADAIIRLRAEYLYAEKRHDEIAFNFTSGDIAKYLRYKEGYRCRVNGNNVSWVKSAAPATGYENFRAYLDMVFMYAGSYSLKKELKSVSGINDIMPGDVIIQGGFPGHAVIVVDVAHNHNGEKIFMLAQSYMPAQDIHILKNPNDIELSPWYTAKCNNKLVTPEWTFDCSDLMRFPAAF